MDKINNCCIGEKCHSSSCHLPLMQKLLFLFVSPSSYSENVVLVPLTLLLHFIFFVMQKLLFSIISLLSHTEMNDNDNFCIGGRRWYIYFFRHTCWLLYLCGRRLSTFCCSFRDFSAILFPTRSPVFLMPSLRHSYRHRLPTS